MSGAPGLWAIFAAVKARRIAITAIPAVLLILFKRAITIAVGKGVLRRRMASQKSLESGIVGGLLRIRCLRASCRQAVLGLPQTPSRKLASAIEVPFGLRVVRVHEHPMCIGDQQQCHVCAVWKL